MRRTQTNLDTSTIPPCLLPYLESAYLYDSSCSAAARTIYVDGDSKAFLKIAGAGKLARERLMTEWLHTRGFAPKVLEYISAAGQDFLLTEALDGEDGISRRYIQSPKRLAAVFGESLRRIHRLPVRDCPIQNRTGEMVSESEANISRGYKDDAIIPEAFGEAVQLYSTLTAWGTDDVVLHGDYCLPNIILRDFTLSGFVDLGTGGVGDRHYDLFWGIWTLRYNLGTDAHRSIFLDAYGRQDLDPHRLELCRLLAGFTY